jgi:hypothetical protein
VRKALCGPHVSRSRPWPVTRAPGQEKAGITSKGFIRPLSLDPLKVCYRLIGICAGKILNGAKPADLTVDQLLAGAASATHADVSSAKNKQRPSAGFA